MQPLDDATFAAAVAGLTETDPHLAAAVDRHGLPLFWSRPPGFATLVLFILEQQVSLASARAAYARLEDRVGTVNPQTILGSSEAELRTDGFSRQKTRYVQLLAADMLAGSIDLDGLPALSDDQARNRLLTLTGVGPWTADLYLLACLRRPDIWPVGDRALQVGTAETMGLEAVPDQASLERIGRRWRPFRSAAARIIWHAYLSDRGRA